MNNSGQNNSGDKDKKEVPLGYIIHQKFFKITGLKSNNVERALYDLTGDCHFEMRKMTNRVLKLVEDMIVSGKYPGYVNGKEISDDDKNPGKLFNVPEDLKMGLKSIISSCWTSMQIKQRDGVERLANELKDNYGKFKNDAR